VLVDGCKECQVSYGVVIGLSLCVDDADGLQWVQNSRGRLNRIGFFGNDFS
jgi:hypothetical protein